MATEEEKTEPTLIEPADNGISSAAEIATSLPLAPAPPPSATQSAENRLGDNQYFFEDQVFFVNKNGRVKFGLVIETCDSYSDDEDNDEDQKLNRGEVRIAWYPSSREHIRSENSIGLADRTLMPGDVVRRMTSGCNPQRGYVRDIKITADVRVLKSPYVIKNVAAERLRPLSVWQRDCTVCLDSWVGSAKDVDERAILMGSNGVRFEIQSADFYHFKEASTVRRPSVFSPLIFFPGNIVSGRLPSLEKAKVLTPDIPLLLNRKGAMLRAKFLVESVRTEGVIVQWQCKALSKANTSVRDLEPPKPYVNAEQLTRVKRLNVFDSCVLQIADRSFLTYEPPKDPLVTKSKWEKELAIRFREMFRQQRAMFFDSNKSKEQTKNSNTTKDAKITTPNAKRAKTLSTDNENSEKEGEWLTTTTATDTSDQSSCGGSENDEADEFVDRTDIESVTTNTGDEDMTENNQQIVGAGGIGAPTKKISIIRNLAKKSNNARYKHQNHARQQASTNKWLHKNAIYVPMNMSSIREGKELITETLLVYSTVSVVWQDGTVEDNIPSTQLYPIHHLDNHEFFPGDFTMLSVEDPKVTFRDYGVIQTVDHQGRTARVKWFTTYAPEDDEGVPTYKGESEVSVYDLKDHPDFTYRPGGMVIRVSNFIGEDAGCTAGQVLDNCIDGRVKVSWDDGHISCCWPQDLYDVGHHEQHDYAGDSDSWETESENSNPGAYEEDEENEQQPSKKTAEDIVFYIIRAIRNLEKFETILKENPQLRERNVMRKLLHIYKKCRYLDRLLQTSFFHEDHFLGLIKRVDKEQNANELLASSEADTPEEQQSNEAQAKQQIGDESEKTEIANKIVADITADVTDSTDKNQPKNYEPTILNCPTSPNDSTSTTSNQKSKTNADPMEKALTAINESPKVVLNFNFRLPNNSTNGNSVVSPKSLNSSNGSNNATTPSRHSRNCTYSGHIVHVRYTPESPLSICGQANTKNASNDAQKQQQDSKQTTAGAASGSENAACTESSDTLLQEAAAVVATAAQQGINLSEETVLLATALLSIEKAYQVTTRIKSAEAAETVTTIIDDALSLPPHDDSGFSRSNSDVGTTILAENDNPVEEIIRSLMAQVDQNLSDGVEEANVEEEPESNELSTTLVCCLSFCTRLRKQIQKCRMHITLQYHVSPITPPYELYDDNDEKSAVEDESLAELETTSEKLDSKSELEKLLTVVDGAVEDYGGDVNDEIKQAKESQNDGVNGGDTVSAAETEKSPAANEKPSIEPWIVPEECFKILPNAPSCHKFISNSCEPSQPQQYFRAVQREHRLLKTSLPKGIWLRFYEDRIDLLSVMMEGPKKTPYENGLYFFDMQLGRDYPKRPPVCHYISYCVDRLNPNLYEEGKVCVSLLGTWSGRDVEVWGSNSLGVENSLLQVLVSIQGLILVPEPYFNEAGYEKQKGSLQGLENSRMYNEMVVIKVTQATLKMLLNPPIVFKDEILDYYKQNGLAMHERIRGWMELSKSFGGKPDVNAETTLASEEFAKPDFPLLPASRGFCLTLESLLKNLEEKMIAVANTPTTATNESLETSIEDETVETTVEATSTPKKSSDDDTKLEEQSHQS